MRSHSLSRRLRTLGAMLAACATLALFSPADAGEAGRAPENKRGQFVSVRDFGAVGDGIADDTAAIQAALNAAKTQALAFLPIVIGRCFRPTVVSASTSGN